MRLILFKYYNFSSLLIKIFCIDFVLVYIKTDMSDSAVPRSRDYIGNKLSVDIGTIKSNFCEIVSRFFGLTTSNKNKANKNALYHLVNITCFCIISATVSAQTTYYVSNTGSDAANGTSTVTAWQTIAKVNSITFVPGDQVLFKDANTWNEALRIKSSGSTQSIKIGRYGVGGVKPAITGFKTATGLTNVGNIWSATLSDAAPNLNVVKVNGTIRAKARYPNTGYLTATSVLSNSALRISHDATNRVGSEIVMMSYPWVLDVATITSHNTGASFDTLNFANVRNGGTGLYYFFQNKSNLLDTLNEWSFDGTTFSVYAASQPIVEYSIIDTLVALHKKSNIIIDGVSFTGANKVAINIDSIRNDTIRNSVFNNNNTAIYSLFSNGLALVSDSIQNSLSEGYHSEIDTSLYVAYNYFLNTGMFEGMGGNGYSTYGHGYNQGDNAIVMYNQFLNSGYHSFRWGGKNNYIYRNYVNGFGNNKGDCGGIYTVAGLGNSSVDYGSRVNENIVINGYGNIYNANYSVGIYLDDYVDSITVEGNTIANMLFADIQTKGAGHTVRYNTLSDSIAKNAYLATARIRFTNNTLYNALNSSDNLYLDVNYTPERLDSNYYIIPQQFGEMKAVHYGSGRYSLANWQALKPSFDIHSVGAYPTGATSNFPTLFFNKNQQDSTISIGSYLNAKEQYFSGSLTLTPFSSQLLFPSVYIAPIKYRSRFRNLKL